MGFALRGSGAAAGARFADDGAEPNQSDRVHRAEYG
jgi:hypothetical protein